MRYISITFVRIYFPWIFLAPVLGWVDFWAQATGGKQKKNASWRDVERMITQGTDLTTNQAY